MVEVPAYHDGEGVIRTRAFFDDISRLPIKMKVWELDSGVSEGATLTPTPLPAGPGKIAFSFRRDGEGP